MTVQISERMKWGGWGIAIGAAITLIIGFSLGGWVTASNAMEQSRKAVVENRAGICAAQFAGAPDYEARLKVFEETDSWKRAKLVENGGWSTMPGEDTADGSVSYGCVDRIQTLLNTKMGVSNN